MVYTCTTFRCKVNTRRILTIIHHGKSIVAQIIWRECTVSRNIYLSMLVWVRVLMNSMGYLTLLYHFVSQQYPSYFNIAKRLCWLHNKPRNQPTTSKAQESEKIVRAQWPCAGWRPTVPLSFRSLRSRPTLPCSPAEVAPAKKIAENTWTKGVMHNKRSHADQDSSDFEIKGTSLSSFEWLISVKDVYDTNPDRNVGTQLLNL